MTHEHNPTQCPHCGRKDKLTLTKMKTDLLVLAGEKAEHVNAGPLNLADLEKVYWYVMKLKADEGRPAALPVSGEAHTKSYGTRKIKHP